MAKLTKPDRIVWCDGSEEERVRLTEHAVQQGILEPLNQEKLPNCFLHRSNPNDVARVENLTFICTPTKEEAGPTNNWMAPKDAYDKLGKLFEGSMKGRTMYVIPYVMAPVGSPMSKVGIEVTDSVYVVLQHAHHDAHGNAPRSPCWATRTTSTAACTRRSTAIRSAGSSVTSPRTTRSGASAPATAATSFSGKKCLALRIGSYLGKQEGWLAEHMLILGVESPEGEMTYVAAAFPSACGKTNFAMMIPPKRFKGWKIWTVGDDIAWMARWRRWSPLRESIRSSDTSVSRPGTSNESNPNAIKTTSRDTIFTNVARTPDGDVWWEGKDGPMPPELIDWQGRTFDSRSTEKAAHPNSRFTAPATNNPFLSKFYDDPQGVPHQRHHLRWSPRHDRSRSSCRRSTGFTGVFLGATLGSETTAAATGKVGVVRRDPFAMLPFCGYNMGDYFAHWLAMQGKIQTLPKVFIVNWFRKGKDGKFLWPGFGENMRVIEVDRRSRAPSRWRTRDAVRLGSEGRRISIFPAFTFRTSKSTKQPTSISTNGRRSSSRKESSSSPSARPCRSRSSCSVSSCSPASKLSSKDLRDGILPAQLRSFRKSWARFPRPNSPARASSSPPWTETPTLRWDVFPFAPQLRLPEDKKPLRVSELLVLALRNELDATELAAHWLPTTKELDVKPRSRAPSRRRSETLRAHSEAFAGARRRHERASQSRARRTEEPTTDLFVRPHGHGIARGRGAIHA